MCHHAPVYAGLGTEHAPSPQSTISYIVPISPLALSPPSLPSSPSPPLSLFLSAFVFPLLSLLHDHIWNSGLVTVISSTNQHLFKYSGSTSFLVFSALFNNIVVLSRL